MGKRDETSSVQVKAHRPVERDMALSACWMGAAVWAGVTTPTLLILQQGRSVSKDNRMNKSDDEEQEQRTA